MSWNKITEMQNPISSGIDEKPVIDILNIINSEDAQVAAAVKKTVPKIKLNFVSKKCHMKNCIVININIYLSVSITHTYY